MRFEKPTFLKIVIALIIVLIITVFIDFRELSGLVIEQESNDEFTATLDGEVYTVLYRPKEALSPLFGLATNEFGTKFALVRDDLPKSARNFVMYHEIYHLQDYDHKSTFSKEIHATLGAFPYAPIGFLQTVFLTLTDSERRNFYLSRIF